MNVWKYEMPETCLGQFEMPIGAEILCAKEQHGRVCIWALVDPMAELEERVFLMYGTGHAINRSNDGYIDSVLLMGGNVVYHLFEAI